MNVTTLNERLFDVDIKERDNLINADINTLITNITFDILKDSPGLVADAANDPERKKLLLEAIIKDIDKQNYHLMGITRDEIIKKTFDYIFGYGPLQEYIEDEDISDIDGTKFDEFCMKKLGVRKPIAVNFGNEHMLDTYCKLIAVRNNGILNENDAHCRVTDEKNRLRINLSIRPRNVSGPSISIRKHRKESYTLEQLLSLNMYDSDMFKMLKAIAISKTNIVICGAGASGKTTLLRAIINNMCEMERVLIAESDAEVYPEKKYCIEQRIKKENEGGRIVTLRDIVRDGLTMSLDTYVIGETTGDEAYEFVKAIHSGHRGLTTTHAISAEDAMLRILTLSKSANVQESEKTIKEMIGRSLDIVIYMEKFKIANMIEVVKYDEIADQYIVNSLYDLNFMNLNTNNLSPLLRSKMSLQ